MSRVKSRNHGAGTPQTIEDASFATNVVHPPDFGDEQIAFHSYTKRFDTVANVDSICVDLQPHTWAQAKTDLAITVVVIDVVKALAPQHPLTWDAT